MNGQAQGVDTFTEDLDENFAADLNESQSQQEESPPPTPQWEIPYEPPVQPAGDPYDDTPPWVDVVEDIQSYTRNLLEEAGSRFRRELAEERLYSRVESAAARAKEIHNGKDGLPPFSDLVDYAIPLLEQQPALRQLVLEQSNPAEALYLIAFSRRYPDLVPQLAARKGKIDASIFRPINFRPTVQGRNSGRLEPSGKVNYADWDNESFEAELARFKLSSEGE
jgi:hypothetical protein